MRPPHEHRTFAHSEKERKMPVSLSGPAVAGPSTVRPSPPDPESQQPPAELHRAKGGRRACRPGLVLRSAPHPASPQSVGGPGEAASVRTGELHRRSGASVRPCCGPPFDLFLAAWQRPAASVQRPAARARQARPAPGRPAHCSAAGRLGPIRRVRPRTVLPTGGGSERADFAATDCCSAGGRPRGAQPAGHARAPAPVPTVPTGSLRPLAPVAGLPCRCRRIARQ